MKNWSLFLEQQVFGKLVGVEGWQSMESWCHTDFELEVICLKLYIWNPTVNQRKKQSARSSDTKTGTTTDKETPTLTAASSFSNVPLRQMWSKLSIIFLGTTYKTAQETRDWGNISGIWNLCILSYQQTFTMLHKADVSPQLFPWRCTLWSLCRCWGARRSGGGWWLAAGLPPKLSPVLLYSKWKETVAWTSTSQGKQLKFAFWWT